MTKTERTGLAVAAIGHVALFAILSVVWSAKPAPLPTPKPVEVSLVDDVALDQTAPPAPEPPAQSTAPDPGPPEDAPPAAAEPEPQPESRPEPAPPKPQPPKPEPAPVPKPAPKPAPKPVPTVKKPVAAEKPEKAKAGPVKATAPPAKAVAATKAAGTNPKATKAKATGSLLDDDFRKGLSQTPSKAKSPAAAPGATMDAKAVADIRSAIVQRVQPCADRQVNPGPGASRIVVTIALQLNRDGSLAARPTVSDDHGGVDDENRRYVDAVDRNAIATFSGCAPLRGLPPELYDVPRGWKTFKLRYKLPG